MQASSTDTHSVAMRRSDSRTIATLHDVAPALHAGTHSLAELAFAHGYDDRAHMHAEFQEHTGMTPRAFVTAAHYPGSISLPGSHR